MANETMSFVLITALFGMAVVALFLTLLSLVMYLIRGTDEALARRGGGVAAAADAGSGRAGAGAARGGSGEGTRRGASSPSLPLWAIAAAAVYLDAEDEAARHSAAPWTARSGR